MAMLNALRCLRGRQRFILVFIEWAFISALFKVRAFAGQFERVIQR